MPTRIDGPAAPPSQLPVETADANVNRSETATAARIAAGTPATKNGSTHPDSIEHAEARASSADEPRHARDARGPEVPAYLMHATGGKSGHAALEAESGKSAGKEAEFKFDVREGVGPRKATPASGSEKRAHFDAHDRYARARPLWTRPLGQSEDQAAEPEHPKDAPGTSSRPQVRFAAQKELFNRSGAVSHHDFKHGKVDLLSAEAKSALGAKYGDEKFVAGATLSAGAHLVNAQGELTGQVGPVDLKGSTYGKVGLDGQAGADVVFDLKAGKLGGKAGVDAFAGASVGAKGSAELGGVAVGAEGHAEAGIGFEANGVLRLDEWKLTAKADAGLCVGIGGDVQVGVTVDVKKVFHELKDAGAHLEKMLDADATNSQAVAARATVDELAEVMGARVR